MSTEYASFKLTDSVFTSLNHRMHGRGIFCDLVKAYGCLSHALLLTKLHFSGIQGTDANWFRSSLTENET